MLPYRVLGKVVEESIELQVNSSMKEATLVDRMEKKAFGMLTFIGQAIEHNSWNVMLLLNKKLLRPHLETL